jgi:hypothetical protein
MRGGGFTRTQIAIIAGDPVANAIECPPAASKSWREAHNAASRGQRKTTLISDRRHDDRTQWDMRIMHQS